MDAEARAGHKKKLAMLESLKVDPHISEVSDVEVNVEPKVLSNHLFKFGLNVQNLNSVVDEFRIREDDM